MNPFIMLRGSSFFSSNFIFVIDATFQNLDMAKTAYTTRLFAARLNDHDTFFYLMDRQAELCFPQFLLQCEIS